MKITRLLFICIFIVQASFAQTWQDTLSQIEKVFNQYRAENPGCQLSISRNGQLIFSKAWGMADLERNVPLTGNSILEAGSVSKQFVAASILLLEQQGKLSLDDDVRKYIPELPVYGSPIRLRHMLHHTSGLRDWGSVAALTGWPRSRKFYSNDDALEIIARQKQLNNKPGDEYIYSNSNYNLFAIIVQRVSGLSLAAFTKKYIFEPAGMTHTQWRDDPNRIVPNRAIAYSKNDSSYETDMPNEYVYGNGGLLTTTEDLLKWCNYYQQGKLGTPSLLAKQVQTDPLNNGAMNNYAAGLVIQKVMGWNVISHSGSTAGYRAYIETFPDLGISLALLSNNSQFSLLSVVTNVSKIFVADKTAGGLQYETLIELPGPKLKNFAGMYRNDRDNSIFNLSVINKNILLDSSVVLKTLSENLLRADNYNLLLKGNDVWMIPDSHMDTIHFTKVNPVHLSVQDLKVYEGTYFSEETNSAVSIHLENEGLMIHVKPGDVYPLLPTYKDAFSINDMDCYVQYSRTTDNKINGLKMSVTRARNVAFKKIK